MSSTFTAPVPVPAPQTSPLNVLITGASRGLGFGMVQQYAEAHAQNHIFAAVRAPDGDTSKALKEYAQQHPNVHIILLDAGKDETIVNSVSQVSKIVDHLDIIINNAGIMGTADPLKVTSADMLDVYHTNAVGPLLVVQSYLPLLKKSSAPKVINMTTSMASNVLFSAFPPATAYGTSKAALVYLTSLLAVAIKDVLFLACAPGWVDTDSGSQYVKAPTTVKDAVQALRYYIAEKNVAQNQGEFFEVTTGNKLAY